jgi:PAS domain S-box-containing protein
MSPQEAAVDFSQALTFLAGGGEMGDVIRNYPWEGTPLGKPESWPQSLKTAVRIMLTSRQPIWVGWGDELIYLYNDAYQSIIGGKHPWAIGKPTRDVWKEIWPQIGPMLATAMGGNEGTYVEEDLLIMERNGYPEETYYTYSYSPIPNDDGTPGGIICANTDDTQRVQSERQLALLRNLATKTVDARTWREACQRSCFALATDPHDITFALLYAKPDIGDHFEFGGSLGLKSPDNSALQAIHAQADRIWHIREILGRRRPKLLSPIPESLCGLVAEGIWKKETASIAVVPIVSQRESARDGALIVGLNPYRLFDESYKEFLSHVAAQISDAIDSADAYEQERRRVEALDELHRAKNTFFSNVSHEFRTPLTLMLGPLEDTLNQDLSVEQTKANIAVAHRNGLRLLRLVNSLLDFSRIESGRVRASYVPTDLTTFSFELASTFRSAIERALLKLELDSEPLPSHVYVDHDMWEKVLLNLLSNAFKFTLEGSIRISVKPSADNAFAVIRVSDTGVGIPESELPHLFERFHRVSGQKSRSIEGSGIGLALVNELIKLHGGEIRCESQLGAGTTMTVNVPFGRAHLPDDQIQEMLDVDSTASARAKEYVGEALRWTPSADSNDIAPLAADAETLTLPDVPATPRKRIVLADDNADMRDYIERLLKGSQWEIETVADGKAALDAIRRQPADLVLTDVMMPCMDGFGLLQAIRNDDATREIPVIILSARAGEEARVEGLDAGADDYLTKPFSARELLARIKSNIDLAQIRSDAKATIREREERLRAALDASRTGTFRWHSRNDAFDYDDSFALLFDLPSTPRVQTLEAFLSRINTQDQARVWDACLRSSRDCVPLEEEFRVMPREGEERWLYAKAETALGPQGEVAYLTGACVDITERKHAQAVLQQRTSQFETLLEQAPVGVYLIDSDFRIREVNPKARPVFGDIPDLIGRDFGEVIRILWPRALADEIIRIFRHTLDTGEPHYEPERAERREDTGQMEYYEWLTSRIPLLNDGYGVVCYFHDISTEVLARQAIARSEERLRDLNIDLENRVIEEVDKRAKAEEALRHAQKMEAIGQLTGGIAHDFNNLLTVIIGGLESIQRSRPDDEARRTRALELAFKGAQRASSLTSRLLAFSRRQPLEPKRLDVNLLVRDMTDLLHRTLGEQIELEGVLTSRLWCIEADKGQLENAIINLAVNARDAMPNGGKLTIETSNTALDEAYAQSNAEIVPGQYVCIAVSDTGEGMNQDTLSHVFEPFFTTKEVGRGTGLGLSMIYGFVKQSGGHVSIYSEVGQGTTIKLYFPRCVTEIESMPEIKDAAAPKSSEGEVILAVEDNDDVRAYTVMTLAELGYHVLEAVNADQALDILRTEARIDLLFTDVVLPGKSGRFIADEAMKCRPDLKVLFATGYSRNAIVHHGRLDPGVNLITKPFTFEQLALKIRDLIDR